mmetsp:Transcript_3844/g.4693  ORF Transcript_3844/g.4693 Transcript_3844/m.4693 type:complete len:270 (-) Transcript_3844:15-824(-)
MMAEVHVVAWNFDKVGSSRLFQSSDSDQVVLVHVCIESINNSQVWSLNSPPRGLSWNDDSVVFPLDEYALLETQPKIFSRLVEPDFVVGLGEELRVFQVTFDVLWVPPIVRRCNQPLRDVPVEHVVCNKDQEVADPCLSWQTRSCRHSHVRPSKCNQAPDRILERAILDNVLGEHRSLRDPHDAEIAVLQVLIFVDLVTQDTTLDVDAEQRERWRIEIADFIASRVRAEVLAKAIHDAEVTAVLNPVDRENRSDCASFSGRKREQGKHC